VPRSYPTGPGIAFAYEYLAAENRILMTQLQGRLRLSDAERATLGAGAPQCAAVPAPPTALLHGWRSALAIRLRFLASGRWAWLPVSSKF
jgi:hypothetical protein